ncbi:flippase [Virgibacillus sp. L01]|uniref:flippase n=1 Tax=Virgibacillus sp. L01 TaxID=3457429 RepID=UPI003FD5C24B
MGKESKELENVTKQSGIVFLGKIVGLVIGLLFNFIAARYLGAEIYGQFTYIFTFISFFPLLVLLGLQQGLVYFIPKLNEEKKYIKRNEIISISYLMVAVLSVVLIIIININNEFITKNILNSSSSSEVLKVMSPLIIFLAFAQLSQSVFRGIKYINPFVINQNFIVPTLKLFILVFAIVLLGNHINTMTIAFYLSIIIGALYLLYSIYKRNLFGGISRNSIKYYKKVLIYSLPLFFTGSLIFISQKTDIFMIGYFLSVEQVGIYRIALQIGTMSSFILIAFNMIFAPTISSLFHKGDISQLESMFKTITKWVVTVNLMAFSLILIFNNEIMEIFGNEFVLGSTALVLVAIGQVVNAGVGSSGYILIMTGYPKYEMYNNILVVCVNILLNLLLIPSYGIEGAACASLVSVALANIIKLVLVYKIHRIHPYNNDFIKVIVSIVISTLLVLIIRSIFVFSYIINLSMYSIMNIGLFLIIMYYLGISPEDKLIFNKVKKVIKGKVK